ncbi:NAD(P)H-quinone oxidoreductase subunit 2 b chloroplastic [Phtheirospermum japonicum]|uniref:NAD(P)H-quinone oxidoreductase subunit 2 b chloroplastic n=1 Tax=Phtheirospermum japonicum TaxID=374723 RepID=A0A830BN50_9LAMI|nr:NAD(P)H-quinone oxidoreductase subunit 2 b chloroplastic [Phtheirospermum japonicum]
MTGRNKEITPHVRNYRRSPLRSNKNKEIVHFYFKKRIKHLVFKLYKKFFLLSRLKNRWK